MNAMGDFDLIADGLAFIDEEGTVALENLAFCSFRPMVSQFTRTIDPW
jgi:hypothetical protein